MLKDGKGHRLEVAVAGYGRLATSPCPSTGPDAWLDTRVAVAKPLGDVTMHAYMVSPAPRDVGWLSPLVEQEAPRPRAM